MRYVLIAIAAAGIWLASSTAHAQIVPGSGNRAKLKAYTVGDGVVIAREILVKHGYEVVRVDVVRDTRVIHYRLGNRGRGRGKGRLMKIVVRPERERIIFVDAPRPVQVDIDVRLGY
jgi:hypothetical protein